MLLAINEIIKRDHIISMTCFRLSSYRKLFNAKNPQRPSICTYAGGPCGLLFCHFTNCVRNEKLLQRSLILLY